MSTSRGHQPRGRSLWLGHATGTGPATGACCGKQSLCLYFHANRGDQPRGRGLWLVPVTAPATRRVPLSVPLGCGLPQSLRVHPYKS